MTKIANAGPDRQARRMQRGWWICSLVLAGLAATHPDAWAGTNGWIDATMLKLQSTEFEFTRSESDVPFMPVLSLSHAAYGKTEFQRIEGGGESIEFRSQSSSAYAMLPLYIGKRSLAMAVPFVSHTRFHFTRGDLQDQSVAAIYLPMGLGWQTDSGNQWGGFLMPAAYSPLTDKGDWAWSGMGGVLGRHLSGDRLVWYYGLVYDYGFSDGYYLPYVGFSYVFDPSWAISMLAPWPSVSYAPSDSFYVRMGVAPSGASWALQRDGADQRAIASFGGWDLGIWGNWKLSRALWLAVGGGFSGLRGLELNSQGEAVFDPKLENEPWISIAISVRPN